MKESEIPDIQNEDANAELAELKKKDLQKEKKIQETFSFETDFLSKKKCTTFYFGSTPISQKCYKCGECKRKKALKICKFCYENCHSICRIDSLIQEEGADINTNSQRIQQNEITDPSQIALAEFVCECGFKLKHKPPKKPKVNIVPCNMMRLDQALDVPTFHCVTHDIPVCCICSVHCHKDCKTVAGKDNIISNKRKCLCQAKQHNGYSEVILTFPLDDYKDLTKVPVWPVTILNILFAHKEEFTKMSELFIHTLDNPYAKIDEYFYHLLELFSNTFNRKFKTPYYDEQLLRMFDFNKIINFLFSLETNNENIALVKFRIISIILFIHLKKDFIMHKTLTSIDFLSAPILSRLRYRHMLQMPSLINNNILQKYLNKDDSIIIKITLKTLSELMTTGMNFLQIEENQDEFEIVLKFICFILKHIILSKEELNTLVSSIYIFFNKFYEKFIKDKSNLYMLLNIFSTLSEILLEITVSYNDIVVDEYLTEEKTSPFIHKNYREGEENSSCGEMIFEMLLRCCDVLKIHYDLLLMNNLYQSEGDKRFQKRKTRHVSRINNTLNNYSGKNINIRFPPNGGLLIEKIVTIIEQTMNIFCLADNFYKTQFNSIKGYDLEDYLLFKKQIKKGTFGNFYGQNDENNNNNKIYELKNNIENALYEFFDNYSIQITTDIHERIIEHLDNFINDTHYIFKNLSAQVEPKNKTNDLKRTLSICESNLSSHRDKIIKKIKDYFPFLDEESFKQDDIKNNFIDSLCLYSLDETLSKLLVYFTDKRFPVLLNIQLFNRIILFFNLYLLNKRGVEYFIAGKNLTRLHKIFKRFQLLKSGKNIDVKFGKDLETNLKYVQITLYFLIQLGKSLRLFNLNIINHKVLDRLQKHILEHLEVLCQSYNNDESSSFITKKHFYLAFKFFNVYEADYSQEDYQEIKRKLLSLFLNSLNLMKEDSNFVSEIVKRNLNSRERGSTHISSTAFYQPSSRNFIFSQNNNLALDNNQEQEIELDADKNLKKVLTFNSMNNDDKDKDKNNLIKENVSNGIKNNINTNANEAGNVISNLIPMENLINEINVKLYFSLFKIINKGIYFVYIGSQEEEIYLKIMSLNPIREIKRELFFNQNKKYMTIKERALLLSVLRVLNLLDHLDRIDLFQKEFALNNKEFKQLVYAKLINIKGLEEINKNNNEELSHEYINKLRQKYNKLIDLEDVIEIYNQELISFPSQCNNEDALNILDYLKEIIFGIKCISDYFFINHDIANKSVLKFYLLIKSFLEKSDLITSMIEDINNKGEIAEEYPKIINKEKITKLQSKSIDLYNEELLYSIINEEIFKIFKKTELNENFDLQTYLDIFDNTNEANFTPFSLIETYDYEYFYQADSEKEQQEASKDKHKKILIDLDKEYIEQFIDVTNTNYYLAFTSLTNENIRFDYRRKMIEYFISFFISTESYRLNKMSPLICIIDKMLFYDGDEMQPRFSKLNDNKYFFSIFNSRIHEIIILTIISCKNPLNFKQSMNNILLCKLFIQFLQLLGEGFNLDYHDNIFSISKDAQYYLDKKISKNDRLKNENISDDINDININSKKINFDDKILTTYQTEKNDLILSNESIFNLLSLNLKKCFFLVHVGDKIEGELPYDKLIVLMTNIIDFLIEFKETTDENNSLLVSNILDLFFGQDENENKDNYFLNLNKKGILREVLSAHISTEDKSDDEFVYYDTYNIAKEEINEEENVKKFLLRKKVICYLKIKFVDLLINYIYLKRHPKIIDKIKKKKIDTHYLFKIIIVHFKQLILQIKLKDEKAYQALIKIQSNKSFVDILLELYSREDIFNDIIEFPLVTKLYLLIKILKELYGDNVLENHFTKLIESNEGQKYPLNKEKNLSIDSYFAIRVYQFLEELILKVEIRNASDNNDNEDKEEILRNEDIGNVSKLIYYKIFPNSDKAKKDKNREANHKQSPTSETFFIRPSLTFRLSNQSKVNFENNVNRESKSEKYMGLIKFSDYALFEMVFNKHIIGNRKFTKFLSSVPYKIIEYINYCFIIVQNILLMNHFYKSPDSDPSEYDVEFKNAVTKQFTDNLIIAIVQVVFTGLISINWFFFKFILTVQHNLMVEEDMNFVFKKKGEENIIPITIVEYFQDKDVSTFSFLSQCIKNVSIFKIIYIIIFHSLLLNTEINMIFFTLILSAIYIKTGVSLLLIIPILFIANINKILGNIFSAMIQNLRQMSLVILFILMISYIYSWISLYFLDDFFNFEVMEYESRHLVEEPFCKSSIQCFFYVTQYGLTAGGGVGETLDKVSFKESPGIFVLRFFYDVIFFSFVTLILFNIFTGIIVGAFADLRDKTNNDEKDRNNVCYICQLDRDGALRENIDFDLHVKKDHFIWNYLYFLAYLHISDPNNLNSIENYVWKKLEEQDNSWIPIKKKDED